MWWRYQQLLLIQHYNTNHINCFILNWLIDDIIFKVCRYVWTSGLCVLPLSVLYLYHNNQAKSATSFSKCEAVYIFCVCMWLCKHPMDLRRGSLGWMMEATLEIVTTSLPAPATSHLRRVPSNGTGKCSWILQHTGFVIMNYSLKCAMHKDLSQQTNCISTAAASAISHNTIVVLVQVCWPLTIFILQVCRA